MFGDAALQVSLVAVAGVLTASASRVAHTATLTMANNLTFSKAVMLPGITLTAGTYVFESGPGGTNPNIVRVLSENRQKLFYLGFTNPVVRPSGHEPSVMTFGETANGATPVLAWYPVGSNQGHEFLYRQ
jgi:hypothetical protein